MNRNVPFGAVPYRTTSSQQSATTDMCLRPSSTVLVRRQMPRTTMADTGRSTMYRQHPPIDAARVANERASLGGGEKQTSRPLPYKLSNRRAESGSLVLHDYSHGSIGHAQVLPPMVRRETAGLHADTGHVLGMSRMVKYPYKAASDTSQMVDLSNMIPSETSRREKDAYLTPSDTSTEKTAYFVPRDTSRREKAAYLTPSDTRTGKTAYFAPSDTSRREKAAYLTPSDTRTGKTVYFAPRETSRREEAAYLTPSYTRTRKSAYFAPSDTSRREEAAYLTPSDTRTGKTAYLAPSETSRREEAAYLTPSATRTGKSAYLAPSDTSRREKTAYLTPSDTTTGKTAYFAPSDTIRREKPAYLTPSDTSTGKTAYFAPNDTSRREKPAYSTPSDTRTGKSAYFSPSDASKKEMTAYSAPSDDSKKETTAYMAPNNTSRRDIMTYMSAGSMASRIEKTYMSTRNNTSRREKTCNETTTTPKTSYKAVGSNAPQKKSAVILERKFQYKGLKKLHDLYVTKSVTQSMISTGNRTSMDEGNMSRDKHDSPPLENISIPHFLMYDGKSQWSAFHMKFQIYSRREHWKASELLDRLCFCLTDAASEYFASCLEKIPDIAYKKLVEKFKNKFDRNKDELKAKPPKAKVDTKMVVCKEEGDRKHVSERYLQMEPTQHGKIDRSNREHLSSDPGDLQHISLRYNDRSTLSSAIEENVRYRQHLSSYTRPHSSATRFIDSRPGVQKFSKDRVTFLNDDAEKGLFRGRYTYDGTSSSVVKRFKSTEQMSYYVKNEPRVRKATEELYSDSYHPGPDRPSEEKKASRLPNDRKQSHLSMHTASPVSFLEQHSSQTISSHMYSEEGSSSYKKRCYQRNVQDRKKPLSAEHDNAWSTESMESYDLRRRRSGRMDGESRHAAGVKREMSEQFKGQYHERIHTEVPVDGRRSHSTWESSERRMNNLPEGGFCRRETDHRVKEHAHALHRTIWRCPRSQEDSRHDVASSSWSSARSLHTVGASTEHMERIGLQRTGRRQLLNNSHLRHGDLSVNDHTKLTRSAWPRHAENKFTVSVNRAKAVSSKYASLDTARRDRDNMKRFIHEKTGSSMGQNRKTVPARASFWPSAMNPQRKHVRVNKRMDVGCSSRQTRYGVRADQPLNIVVTITKKVAGNKKTQTSKQLVSDRPEKLMTCPSVEDDPSVEFLPRIDKKKKKMPTCFMKGCSFQSNHMRMHVIVQHLPQCFHDDYMNSRLPQVESCLQWLCDNLLGKGNDLTNLMNYVNDWDLIQDGYRVTLADHVQVRMMCQQLSVSVLPMFTMKPLNSIALLCHWRVMGSLMNLLQGDEIIHFMALQNVLPGTNVGRLSTKQKVEVNKSSVVHKDLQQRTASVKPHMTELDTSFKNMGNTAEKRKKSTIVSEKGMHATQIQSRSCERKRRPVSSSSHSENRCSDAEELSGDSSLFETRIGCKRKRSDKSAMITHLAAKKRRVNPKTSSPNKSNPSSSSSHSRDFSTSKLEGIDLSEFQVVDDIDDEACQPGEDTSHMNTLSHKTAIPVAKSKGKRREHTIRRNKSRNSHRCTEIDVNVHLPTSREDFQSSTMEELDELPEAFEVVDEVIANANSSPSVAGDIDEAPSSVDASSVLADDTFSDVMDLSQFSVVDEIGHGLAVPDGDDDDFSQFSVIDEV